MSTFNFLCDIYKHFTVAGATVKAADVLCDRGEPGHALKFAILNTFIWKKAPLKSIELSE